MIVYKRDTNGMAHDLTFKTVPDADDLTLPGDLLPKIETLNSPAYIAQVQAEEAAKVVRDAQRLEDIMVKFGPWATMKADIKAAFPDPKMQKVITRIARVVNWLAKDSAD